jgi:hypothetical protein
MYMMESVLVRIFVHMSLFDGKFTNTAKHCIGQQHTVK